MTAPTRGAAPGSGRNVLSALDARVPTSFLWSLTLLATIGGFLFGYDIIALFLPETKGRSVEEITELFQHPARQAVPASLGSGPPGVTAGQGATRGDRGTSQSGNGGGSG